MAWMASHLFVRCDPPHRDSLVDGIEGLLADPGRRTDQDGLLEPPGPVTVSPVHEGWVAVTGAGLWLRDLPAAARELARSRAATAIASELIGNCYRLRLGVYEGEGEPHLLQTPAGSWGECAPTRGAMPLHEDAELLAYRTLREAGVPGALIVLGAAPLGVADHPRIVLGPGTSLRPEGEGVMRRETELAGVTFAGEDPPVLPTELSQDFGLMLFETRYLEGRPTDATVDRLLEIEEALLARARRAQPGSEVSLTVTYFAGDFQDRMDALLRARGRPTAAYAERGARQPWWQFWRHFGRLK